MCLALLQGSQSQPGVQNRPKTSIRPKHTRMAILEYRVGRLLAVLPVYSLRIRLSPTQEQQKNEHINIEQVEISWIRLLICIPMFVLTSFLIRYPGTSLPVINRIAITTGAWSRSDFETAKSFRNSTGAGAHEWDDLSLVPCVDHRDDS